MAIKFAPKDPVKDAATEARKAVGAASAERQKAAAAAAAADATPEGEPGSDLFSKAGAKRKKK